MKNIRSFLELSPADVCITGIGERSAARESIVFGAAAVFVGLTVAKVSGAGTVAAVVLAATVGCAGAFAPVRRARTLAGRKRGEFDLAVSVLVDLMNIQTAGGAGIETSLLTAASMGDGWCFALIRESLAGAQASRTSYWDALVLLGESLGCSSLSEVAHSARMAGEHGSRIRQTLASKSASLRARNLARIEAEAQQRTEQMGLPMVLLFVSFLVFVGYPALAQTMAVV